MYQLREYSDILRHRPVPISWKVPVFCNNDWVGLRVLEYCRQMGAERPFDIAFGAPLCAWAGGRPSMMREQLSEAQLEAYFTAYEDYGVKVALTLSRLAVDEDAIPDPYCNMMLDVAERHGAQAIIVDDRLLGYVKSTHPGIATIASLDKAMCELKDDYSAELSYYRQLLDRFDEVVVRCECALDDSLIMSLADVTDRVEIIVNQVCMPNCRHCDAHIASMERMNDGMQPAGRPANCFYLADAKDPETWLASNLTIPESRIEQLAAAGFTKMKLAGRNASQPKLLDTFSRYVFEPTGMFWNVQNFIARDYKDACQAAGHQIAPFELPE